MSALTERMDRDVLRMKMERQQWGLMKIELIEIWVRDCLPLRKKGFRKGQMEVLVTNEDERRWENHEHEKVFNEDDFAPLFLGGLPDRYRGMQIFYGCPETKIALRTDGVWDVGTQGLTERDHR